MYHYAESGLDNVSGWRMATRSIRPSYGEGVSIENTDALASGDRRQDNRIAGAADGCGVSLSARADRELSQRSRRRL